MGFAVRRAAPPAPAAGHVAVEEELRASSGEVDLTVGAKG